MDDKHLKDFSDWGVDPPTTVTHGTIEDIQDRMKQMLPNSWKLEGNQLTGETPLGTITQTIPTDYILTGTDPAGLPIFKKVVY